MTHKAEPRARVHVAITRRVRPGAEAEFEAAIADFFADAARSPGIIGAYLLQPIHGADNREYGILRTFADEAAMERFYASTLYRQWNDRVAPLVDGPSRRRELHGMEAFFPSDSGPPPWKMAILTWIGVNPAVYVFAGGIPKLLGALPPLVELALVNALVVAALTWILMPLITRTAARWLEPSAGGR